MLSIGVDMGGVCSSKSRVYEETDGEIKKLIDVPDCLKYLNKLKDDGHELVLVSFCGKRRARETRLKLLEEYKGLFDKIFFVKDKKKKGMVCDYNKLDVMIDDRLDVLSCINRPPKYLINYVGDVGDNSEISSLVTVVENWEDIYDCISKLKPLKHKRDGSINLDKILYT